MMMLKALISNWLREQAHEHVLNVIRDSLDPRTGDAAPATPAPPCEIAILFATSVEAAGTADGLSGRLTLHCASHLEHSGVLDGCRLAVVEAGHGQAVAATAALETIRLHHPRWLISAGFASALVPEMRRGHVLMANEVIDRENQRIPIDLQLDARSLQNNPALHVGRLVTVDHLIRTGIERRQLALEYAALACDLETWGVAEACRQAGTRFLSVRVMTEVLDDLLPNDVERLLQQRSAAAKLGAAAGSVWRRPSVAKDLWRFNEDALKASDRLARFLSGLVKNLPA